MLKRCSACSLDYPASIHKCLVCGGATWSSYAEDPPPDWEAQVKLQKGEAIESDDAARVRGWRTEYLVRAGYPFSDAETLGRSECDLHRAEDLLSRGCPTEIAVRILL